MNQNKIMMAVFSRTRGKQNQTNKDRKKKIKEKKSIACLFSVPRIYLINPNNSGEHNHSDWQGIAAYD